MASPLPSLAFLFEDISSDRDGIRCADERRERGAVSAQTDQKDTDQALLVRLRAGDTDAFATLLSEVVPGLVRYATRMLGRSENAEDIVQDVLARMWLQRRTLAITTTVRAYLFTAVRNGALNVRKHERVAATHAQAAAPHPHISDPSDHIVGTLTVEQLLAHLPERRREAVELRYIGQLSFAEVAAVLRTTPVNAERLVARGVETLRRIVQTTGKRNQD